MRLTEVSQYVSAMAPQQEGDTVSFRTVVKSENKKYFGKIVGKSGDTYKIKTPDGRVWDVNEIDIVKKI